MTLSETSQKSKIEILVKIVSGWKLLTIFAKILEVWLGSYLTPLLMVFAICKQFYSFFIETLQSLLKKLGLDFYFNQIRKGK